jgi:GDP-D-mannose dehydratase
MTDKVPLITGATKQDSPYLFVLLFGKGYLVHGRKRHLSR